MGESSTDTEREELSLVDRLRGFVSNKVVIWHPISAAGLKETLVEAADRIEDLENIILSKWSD